MSKIKRFLTVILAVAITLTAIPTAEAEAASEIITAIQFDEKSLTFHTDMMEYCTKKVTLLNAKASKVTWKVKNAKRYKNGKAYTVKASKVAKVSKNGNVRAIGWGTADLVATYKGKTYTQPIRVADYNKLALLTNGNVVSSETKKADKIVVKELKKLLSMDNVNDQIWEVFEYCHANLNNVYSYLDHDYNDVSRYLFGAFVNGWSYCENTARIAGVLLGYCDITANIIPDYSINHSWNKVYVDGTWYQFDADAAHVPFMSTQEEIDGTYDDQPWLYNEGENGNGRAYFYGYIIKDAAHLKDYFRQMKAEGKTTFKFRDWYDYKNHDTSVSKEMMSTLSELLGVSDDRIYKYLDTYEGTSGTVVVSDGASLDWENCSYEVTINDWNLINLD